MLFMVIERFIDRDAVKIGERFRHSGRLLPEGVIYHASWVDAASGRCFQLMEAAHAEQMNLWAGRWRDLIEFEIVAVETSSDFWSEI